MKSFCEVIVSVIALSVLCIIFRIFYLITFKCRNKFTKKNARTLIIIGSGGHTHELLQQIKTLNPNFYEPRLYVMADMDHSSEYKIREVESGFTEIKNNSYEIVTIPRSRNVNQSYFSSVFTTAYSFINSIPIVLKFKPDLIICNGPGTCVPICVFAFLLNIFICAHIKIIFIESICRVKTLSLSGRILLNFADITIVQWSALHEKYPKTIFLGRLT